MGCQEMKMCKNVEDQANTEIFSGCASEHPALETDEITISEKILNCYELGEEEGAIIVTTVRNDIEQRRISQVAMSKRETTIRRIKEINEVQRKKKLISLSSNSFIKSVKRQIESNTSN